MRLHKEGTATLLLSSAVLCFALFGIWRPESISDLFKILLSVPLLVLFVLMVRFFRDPKTVATRTPMGVLAPADGKVVVIEHVMEPEYFKDERLQVSIFMSPLNVHINYYPVAGEVKYFKYHAGKYLVAWHPKSSELNERTSIVVRHPDHGEILIRQIAGAVARRICTYSEVGMDVDQGSELGFIKFGSRVDVFLPSKTPISVALNELVKGATTVIAHFEKK